MDKKKNYVQFKTAKLLEGEGMQQSLVMSLSSAVELMRNMDGDSAGPIGPPRSNHANPRDYVTRSH